MQSGWGFDVKTGQYAHMMVHTGIVDPASVLQAALTTASSMVQRYLTIV